MLTIEIDVTDVITIYNLV